VLNCVGAGAAQLIALVGEAEAKCAALAEENAKLRRDVALKTNAGGLAAAYNDAAQQGGGGADRDGRQASRTPAAGGGAPT
jgi:hypothetical protein